MTATKPDTPPPPPRAPVDKPTTAAPTEDELFAKETLIAVERTEAARPGAVRV